jgi:formate/nitrite transporter FocA (FNT family)
MIQIPYAAIATGIAVLLGIWAFVEAESAAGRVVIAVLMLVIFVLSAVWRSEAGRVAGLIAWSVFGIGCYVFVKLRGVAIR